MKQGTALLALLLAICLAKAQNEYRASNLDLIRLLSEKPWLGSESQYRWDEPSRTISKLDEGASHKVTQDSDEGISSNFDNGDLSVDLGKRSAVATALNAGRRRRQPTPALGVLNDMGSFFDLLRDNLETLASLSPHERSTLFQEHPQVLQAPSAGAGISGGGSGMRRLHALRPLRPTGNIRSYNRRSFVDAVGSYPGANHHDPALLWTGLGRR
ncbi:uncharacterized protein [Battus philenor]|uniref:uncharacterized protein n=1 Tax=Battus philenor TaxID=42288 RepID=UPI0035CFF464